MRNWNLWQKLVATMVVNVIVVVNLVWLLFHSKWAKPKAGKDDVR